MADMWESAQNVLFTVTASCAGRIFLARDLLLGRMGRLERLQASAGLVSRHAIPSGGNLLDAVLAEPSQPATSLVLICHGIGEVVEHWLPAQQALAEEGVASLVFDYSGYGRSTGLVAARQCEDDAIAAFRFLQGRFPGLPVSLLGFSLGSGIAVAVLPKLPAHRLVLCSAFTSFRAAAARAGLPRGLAFLAPDIWRTADSLPACKIPALIVHCAQDRLFPVAMARELHAACGSPCQLRIEPGLAHDDPYYHPQASYWGKIASFLN